MSYTVTDTREVSRLTQGGAERKMYRVWLTTSEGATGSVDIPENDWTEERVPEILEEKARQLDLAFSLNSA